MGLQVGDLSRQDAGLNRPVCEEVSADTLLADVTSNMQLVAQEMTGALASQLQVPLKVDLEAGPNWLDTQELQV